MGKELFVSNDFEAIKTFSTTSWVIPVPFGIPEKLSASPVIFPKNRNEYKYSFKFGKDEIKQIYRGSDCEDIV